MACQFASCRIKWLILASAILTIIPAEASAWLPIGPDGGDARRIATDPKDQTHFYLGAANGWIFESQNSGASWRRIGLVGKRDDLVLDSIVVDRKDSSHLIVGAWVVGRSDGGLFVSRDGGHTWSTQADLEGQSIRALSQAPSDPAVFVAGSLQGVFRSVDSGEHWARISPPGSSELHEIQSVAVDPKDSNTIYVGTWHLPWKTIDGGRNWSSIKQGIIDDSDVFSIIVDPRSPHSIYASACSGIYKSEDAGALFHKVQGIPSTARRTRVLLQDPHELDIVWAGTTEGLFRSKDAGKTWNRTTGPDLIINDISIELNNSSHMMLATNRGGVLSSDDGGETFHSSNGGFSARQVTAFQQDLMHPGTLFIGVVNDKDWGGVFESKNFGINWAQRSEGLEANDVFSLGQAPDGTIIAGTAHGPYRLEPEGKTWQRVMVGPIIPATKKEAGVVKKARIPILMKEVAPTVHIRASGVRRRSAATGVKIQSSTRHGNNISPSRVPSFQTTARGRSSSSTAISSSALAPFSGDRAVKVSSVDSTVSHSVLHPFDCAFYSLARAEHAVIAATSIGVLTSSDNGTSWRSINFRNNSDWHLLASVHSNVVAGSASDVIFSADSGSTWSIIKVPKTLTQISALAVEPSGAIWVGSREGLIVSHDAGNTWSTPTDIYLNSVTDIFYDEASGSMTVTSTGDRGVVYSVQLPQKTIAYYESGWSLRFSRPLGDRMISATLFDGLVVQPRRIVP